MARDGAFGEGCLYQVLSLFFFFPSVIFLFAGWGTAVFIGLPLLALSVWLFARGYRRARE